MIIGLTGGIASGKSTAAKTFAELGAYVIDADKLGHNAYLSGSEAFAQVVATFGEEVVGDDGEINRQALGAKVFGGESRLDELTAIVWPAIRQMAQAEITKAQQEDAQRHVVLEAAVLIEAQWQDIVDQVWVTVVDRAIAISRATQRDGVDAAAIEARIAAQLSNEERIAAAEVVIDNNSDEAHLIEQIRKYWSEIC